MWVYWEKRDGTATTTGTAQCGEDAVQGAAAHCLPTADVHISWARMAGRLPHSLPCAPVRKASGSI